LSKRTPINLARNTRTTKTLPHLPDPVEPGSTSDVPIHGEKKNIHFHPNPSVSYEPMYEALEKRTAISFGVVLLAIIVRGEILAELFTV
jgi:hypothetical protein